MPVRAGNGSSPRRRHWLRWTVAGLTALVILAAAAVGAFIKLQPSPAALRLPAGAAQPPAGPAAGRWDVAAGSLAGFRVRESALGISNDVVGRTSAVTGALVVSGDRVTAAAFRVDLTAIRVGGKAESQLATSLGTRQYPVATFTLTGAVPLQLRLRFGRDGHPAGGRPANHARTIAAGDGDDLGPPGRLGAAGRGNYPGGLLRLAHRGAEGIRHPGLAGQPRGGRVLSRPATAVTEPAARRAGPGIADAALAGLLRGWPAWRPSLPFMRIPTTRCC